MKRTSIGEFIAALRKARGYTQQDVADALGVSNKTVSSWETGASLPDISMIPSIAELYGVTCDEILRAERIAIPEPLHITNDKRNKSLKNLLNRYRYRLTLISSISLGLCLLTVLTIFLFSFAIMESRIGFFVALVPLLTAVILTAFGFNRIKFLTEQEEFETQSLVDLNRYRFNAAARVYITSLAAFFFILPHAFVPRFTGLTLTPALELGLAGAFIGAVIGFIARFIAKIRNPYFAETERKKLRFFILNNLTVWGLLTAFITVITLPCLFFLWAPLADETVTLPLNGIENVKLLAQLNEAEIPSYETADEKFYFEPEQYNYETNQYETYGDKVTKVTLVFAPYTLTEETLKKHFNGFRYQVAADGTTKLYTYRYYHCMEDGSTFSFDILNPALNTGNLTVYYIDRAYDAVNSEYYSIYQFCYYPYSHNLRTVSICLTALYIIIVLVASALSVFWYLARRRRFLKSLS
ncbi:MAG: helix-turn-helix transcriptional regulator [Clostridia bacterium]|nr:helix-turn-helix transcriptional regulator [Clostridia bacterium]